MIPDFLPISPWHTVSPLRFRLGESPRTAHGQVRWVDIETRTLYAIKLDRLSILSNPDLIQPHAWEMPDQIACIIATTDPSVWIGFGRTAIWELHDDGAHRVIMNAPFDSAWQRFNDGCCDEWGRVWVSSLIDDKRAPLASLYCLQGDHLHTVMTGLTTGNGTAYSQRHRKLWLADTFTKTIRRFDVNAATTELHFDGWSYRYTHSTERPDGAVMIDENHYCVAVIDGFRLDVFNLTSDQPIAHIPVDVIKPTMPCILPQPASALLLTTAASQPEKPGNANESDETHNGRLLMKSFANAQCAIHLFPFHKA